MNSLTLSKIRSRSVMSKARAYPPTWSIASDSEMFIPVLPITTPSSTSWMISSRPVGISNEKSANNLSDNGIISATVTTPKLCTVHTASLTTNASKINVLSHSSCLAYGLMGQWNKTMARFYFQYLLKQCGTMWQNLTIIIMQQFICKYFFGLGLPRLEFWALGSHSNLFRGFKIFCWPHNWLVEFEILLNVDLTDAIRNPGADVDTGFKAWNHDQDSRLDNLQWKW